MKTEITHMKISFGARPFTPSRVEEEPAIGSTDTHGAGHAAPRSGGPQIGLPLTLGPLGSLAAHGRQPFDFRIAGQSEFQFSSKGGDQWKGKTERYFMSVVPAAYPLL